MNNNAQKILQRRHSEWHVSSCDEIENGIEDCERPVASGVDVTPIPVVTVSTDLITNPSSNAIPTTSKENNSGTLQALADGDGKVVNGSNSNTATARATVSAMNETGGTVRSEKIVIGSNSNIATARARATATATNQTGVAARTGFGGGKIVIASNPNTKEVEGDVIEDAPPKSFLKGNNSNLKSHLKKVTVKSESEFVVVTIQFYTLAD